MAKEISKQLEVIEKKIDAHTEKLEEHTKILSSVDKTLALQEEQLRNHIYRTQLAEENLEILRKEFKPVEKHVHFVNTLSKLVALLATVGSAVYGVLEVVKWIIS